MNDDSLKSNCKSTPPTNRKVLNPFDKALIGRLHNPICSPGMCKIYKKQSNGLFRWDIDQACTLDPAEIIPCNSQFEPSPDPALEKIAEEATEKFFSQDIMMMPSPLESSKKVKTLETSYNACAKITSMSKEETVITRDVSAQTVLSLPPELPPVLEKLLSTYCTFTQDQNISGEYEITANGSLRRKLFFESHSDMEQEHYDSEQTDEEAHTEGRRPWSYEAHSPVVFSPDISKDLVAKGMKRTFSTPLKPASTSKAAYRNKILDVGDFGEPCLSPIQCQTPLRPAGSVTSSLASSSISPLNKAPSSDEEKNNFTSPESEAMATCLDSKSSFSEKRSLSMSSLHRSRSCQKLDFSMDMSLDASLLNQSQGPSSSALTESQAAWSMIEESGIDQLVKLESLKSSTQVQLTQSSMSIHNEINVLDETPIKGKGRSNILTHGIRKIRSQMMSPLHVSLDGSLELTHGISKIRSQMISPLHISLDGSLDNFETPLNLEHKKVDFSNVDLKFLTEPVSQFEHTKAVSDSSTSFKRVDSCFNENTFDTNASSYYESAIKPSELTVTHAPKAGGSFPSSSFALKEISNVNWMRVDSGFKNENSTDNVQFYGSETSTKSATVFGFSEAKLEDKKNDFDRFYLQASNKNEATMSMSDRFTDDMTFHCNFSSTPSKNKPPWVAERYMPASKREGIKPMPLRQIMI